MPEPHPGQPRNFNTPEELQAAINKYFIHCEATDEHITICGLALALGFVSRQSIYDNEKIPEYSYIIKNARLRVENNYEQHLFTPSCAGPIFALKNMGWKDKIENEHSGSMQITRAELPAKKDVGAAVDL